MAQKMSLAQNIQRSWEANNNQGVHLLVLVNRAIENTKVNRDWDALAWFLSGAVKNGHGNVAKQIIRAAFGERIKLDNARGKTHPSGVAFKLSWEAGDVINFGNTYAVVGEALAKGESLFNPELGKALTKMFAAPKKDPALEDKISTIAKAIAKATKDFDLPADILEGRIAAKVKEVMAEMALKAKAA